MFCISCGTKLPDNAKFCSHCGLKTDDEELALELVSEYKKISESKKPSVHSQSSEQVHKPRCPMCGSTNLIRIGAGHTFLLMNRMPTKKSFHTFECQNCGYLI